MSARLGRRSLGNYASINPLSRYNTLVFLCTKAGGSIPEQLDGLLALFHKLEQTAEHRLFLNGNPWKEPPEAIVKKGMTVASEYFIDLFKEGVSVRRNMIKVVLVGQEGAGKTR